MILEFTTGNPRTDASYISAYKGEYQLTNTTNRGHETVKHYLLDCLKTSRLWAKLTAELGREARSLKTLLSNPKGLKPLMIFIGKTGRFGDTYGTMILPEPRKRAG